MTWQGTALSNLVIDQLVIVEVKDQSQPLERRMGNFYSNIVITRVAAGRVVEWMQSRGTAAFVETSDLGCVIFDEAADSDYSHDDLAREISGTLHSRAMVVTNHDDDILSLEVYDDGTLVDSYNSAPDYFDPEVEAAAAPTGGDRLADLYGVEAAGVAAAIKGDFVFAVERHAALFDELGLPKSSCGCSFEYILADGAPIPSDPSAVLVSIDGE